MSNIAGQLSIASNDADTPLVITLATNKRFPNTEQTCESGYTGTPIAAGTVYGDTQEAADAAAEAMLECVLDAFNPPTIIGGYIEDLGIQSDGKVVIVGSFSTVGGVTMKNVARLNADGTRDTSVTNLNPTNIVDSVIVRGDDTVVVSGAFTTIAATTRGGAARLNADMTIDLSFGNPALAFGNIYASERADGKVYVAGDISGEIKRLNTDGTVDGGFTMSGLTALGYVVKDHAGYGVLVDGYDGPTYGVYRLTGTGALDGTFASKSCNGTVYCMAVQSADGYVLVGGEWGNIGGDTGRDDLVRLTAAGAIDSGFTPPNFVSGSGVQIRGIAVQGDGKIVVVGRFETVNGSPMAGVVRLNNDGSVDGTWPNLDADNTVICVKIRNDGRIVVGGQFSSIGGETMSKIAVINTDGTLAN